MNNQIAEIITKLHEAVSIEFAQVEQTLMDTRDALSNLMERLPVSQRAVVDSAPDPNSSPAPHQSEMKGPEVEPGAVTAMQCDMTQPVAERDSVTGITAGHQPKRYLQIHTVLEIAKFLDTGFKPEDVAKRAREMGILEFSERHLGQTMAHLAKKKKNPVLQVISPGRGRKPATYRFVPPDKPCSAR